MKCKKKALAFLLLQVLLFVAYSKAQPYHLSFKHLTVDNGLPVGHVTKFFKDSQGFLWVGSDNGLARFDGSNVVHYLTGNKDSVQINGSFIHNILEDKKNNLWIFTNKSLCYYQRSLNKIHFIKSLSGELSSIPTRLIEWLNDSTMMIGLIEDFTLFHTHSKTFQKINPQTAYQMLYNIVKPKTIKRWVLGYSKKNGLIILEKQTNTQIIKTFFSTGNHLSKLFDATSKQMYQQNDSMVWLISIKGMDLLNLHTGKFTTYAPDNFWGRTGFSILYYHEDKLWITSTNSGLWLFDIATKKFLEHWQANVSDNASLSYNNISETMLIDDDQNIWLGVFGKGIDYANLFQKKFIHYLSRPEAEKLNMDNFIRCMARDKQGNVWCGAMNGEVYVLNAQKQPIRQFKKLNNARNFSTTNNIAFDAKGRLWLMEDYLFLYNSSKKRFDIVDTSSSYCSMLQSKTGKLFFTCGDGFIKEVIEKNGSFEFQRTKFSKCIGERSTFFEDKKGRVYVNSTPENLTVYQSVNNACIVYKLNNAGIIKCFHETDSILWMGTNNGLYKINPSNFTYQVITVANGLPDNCIYGIADDKNNNLWLSTNNGLCRFSLQSGKCRNYTSKDGLQSNEFNTNGFLQTPDGELWFSGVNGINAFYPSTIKEDVIVPQIQFTGIKVNDEVYEKSNLDTGANLKLDYQSNTISFNFIGINLYEPENVQLQYQLQGIDKNWLPAINPGFARYANLKAGIYHFNIKAANTDGIFNPVIKSISIQISAPFYMTWWFYVLCAALICAAIYAYIRFRISQINHMYEIRNKIANDLHDDVGSALSTISLYSEVANLKIDHTAAEVKSIIQKIKTISQQMQDSMHEIVWGLHHKNDSMEQLLQKLQVFSVEATSLKKMELIFFTDENVKKIKLQQEQRNTIFMVVKEAVNNAVKYSNSPRISISFSAKNAKLFFSITDEGKGFEIETVSKGHGLSAMQERINKLKGKLSITTNPNEGTRIWVEIGL